MPHIGCGADVLRWRREKAQEVRRLQILGLLPKPEDFKPAKNCQYPHQTVARDPDVFNRRLCSWERIAQLQAERDSGASAGLKSVSSAPAIGREDSPEVVRLRRQRRVFSATTSVEAWNLSKRNSSITKSIEIKAGNSIKNLSGSSKSIRDLGSNSEISQCPKSEDVTVDVKRRFFRTKSKTIIGPDAFNQEKLNKRQEGERGVLERSQSCNSPTKRSKNNENQNRQKYFSRRQSEKLQGQPSAERAKPASSEEEEEEKSEVHCYRVSVQVHQPGPPSDIKLASLASIDEIVEFEQELAQLEAGMLRTVV